MGQYHILWEFFGSKKNHKTALENGTKDKNRRIGIISTLACVAQVRTKFAEKLQPDWSTASEIRKIRLGHCSSTILIQNKYKGRGENAVQKLEKKRRTRQVRTQIGDEIAEQKFYLYFQRALYVSMD